MLSIDVGKLTTGLNRFCLIVAGKAGNEPFSANIGSIKNFLFAYSTTIVAFRICVIFIFTTRFLFLFVLFDRAKCIISAEYKYIDKIMYFSALTLFSKELTFK